MKSGKKKTMTFSPTTSDFTRGATEYLFFQINVIVMH